MTEDSEAMWLRHGPTTEEVEALPPLVTPRRSSRSYAVMITTAVTAGMVAMAGIVIVWALARDRINAVVRQRDELALELREHGRTEACIDVLRGQGDSLRGQILVQIVKRQIANEAGDPAAARAALALSDRFADELGPVEDRYHAAVTAAAAGASLDPCPGGP